LTISQLEIAIENLTDHCEAVLKSHGHLTSRSEVLSTVQHELDIPYGHGVTLGGEGRSDDQLSEVQGFLSNRPKGSRTGVNDSYSSLDLGPLGFETLFSDPFMFRDPGSTDTVSIDGFSVVEASTPDERQEFEAAAAIGFGSPSTTQAYVDTLLGHPGYHFYLGRSGGETVSGVSSFNNGTSLGIYSLFTFPEARNRGYGEAVARAAMSGVTDIPVVSSASDMSFNLFGRLGLQIVGKRTIWIHPGS